MIKIIDSVLIVVCLTVTVLAIGKIKKEENVKLGAVRLEHGVFKCLGALLSPKVVITCCTCVSDVSFDKGEESKVGYELRAIPPNAVIVVAGNDRLPASEVTIHPQCDIDGTYDYGIVKVDKNVTGEGGSGDLPGLVERIWFADKRLVSWYRRGTPLNTVKRLQNAGTCSLVTILNDDAIDAKLVKIPTKFVDWKGCWNGSETKPAFESKYCVMSLDGTPITLAKCGSPIYCNEKLVGVLARRYAIGGREYASVNGLDGAADFVKETAQLDLEVGKELENEDFGGENSSDGQGTESLIFGRKSKEKTRKRIHKAHKRYEP